MDTCTLIFFAAVLRRAKIWKQPKCPLTDEWLKKMWFRYTVEYYSAIKGWNNAICGNVDKLRDHHSRRSKSDRKDKCYTIQLLYIWYLKMMQINLFTETETHSQTCKLRGSARSPREGKCNPLQYSCLENPMGKEPGRLQPMGLQRIRHNWVTNIYPYMTTGKTIALTIDLCQQGDVSVF